MGSVFIVVVRVVIRVIKVKVMVIIRFANDLVAVNSIGFIRFIGFNGFDLASLVKKDLINCSAMSNLVQHPLYPSNSSNHSLSCRSSI